VNESAYSALLFIDANRTALGLSAMGCFLAASLLGLFFLRGIKPSVALLFGAAQAGVYLALLKLTGGTWGFWLHEASGPLLDLLGSPPAPLDGAHRTLFYGVPAVLHGFLAAGLSLFLWKRISAMTHSGGTGGATPPPAGGGKGGKKGRGKGKRKK